MNRKFAFSSWSGALTACLMAAACGKPEPAPAPAGEAKAAAAAKPAEEAKPAADAKPAAAPAGSDKSWWAENKEKDHEHEIAEGRCITSSYGAADSRTQYRLKTDGWLERAPFDLGASCKWEQVVRVAEGSDDAATTVSPRLIEFDHFSKLMLTYTLKGTNTVAIIDLKEKKLLKAISLRDLKNAVDDAYAVQIPPVEWRIEDPKARKAAEAMPDGKPKTAALAKLDKAKAVAVKQLAKAGITATSGWYVAAKNARDSDASNIMDIMSGRGWVLTLGFASKARLTQIAGQPVMLDTMPAKRWTGFALGTPVSKPKKFAFAALPQVDGGSWRSETEEGGMRTTYFGTERGILRFFKPKDKMGVMRVSLIGPGPKSGFAETVVADVEDKGGEGETTCTLLTNDAAGNTLYFATNGSKNKYFGALDVASGVSVVAQRDDSEAGDLLALYGCALPGIPETLICGGLRKDKGKSKEGTNSGLFGMSVHSLNEKLKAAVAAKPPAPPVDPAASTGKKK